MFNPLRRAERLASKEERELGTTSWAWWPWSLKRSSSARYTTIDLDPTVEEKKYVFTIDTFSVLSWHTWTFISCAVSGVLLYLNFSQYTIGTEVGKDKQGTRNILGSLQLAAKAHEITMVVSLGNIAQQWIQQCLLDDGLLLGLLGAESSLSNVALLISREFRAAICCSVAMLYHRGEGQYAYHQRQRGKKMILLLGWLSLSCLLCSLAGPSSAVLMIPRYDWFHERDIARELVLTYQGSSAITEERYTAQEPFAHYPNVFIAPEFDKNEVAGGGISFRVGSGYWKNAMSSREAREESSYLYDGSNGLTQTRIQVNTSLDRPLVAGAPWTGFTTLSSVMTPGIVKTNLRLRGYDDAPKSRSSGINYVAELVGIEVNTVCRRQERQLCNSPEWCYHYVTKESSDSRQQSSQSLLLLYDSTPYEMRFWITEGPMNTSTTLSDSIVVILEDYSENTLQKPPLIVCSINATLKSVTASSATRPFSPDKFEFHDYISYYDGRTPRKDGTRKLLYHSSWLESLHGANISTGDSKENTEKTPCNYDVKLKYDCRGQIRMPANEHLIDWGKEIRYAVGYGSSDYWWEPSQDPIDASLAETIIGGLFISAFLSLKTSRSQYPQLSYTSPPIYPGLMIEDTEDYSKYTNPPIKIERLLYGFKLSSRSSIISVIVLIAHAILVLIGSLWQYRSISLTQAWGSMPEYAMLCLGSDPARATCGVENTCAGIGQNETLNKVVRIREVAEEHLELLVVSPETTLLGSVVNPEKRYGALRQEGRMKEKLE